MFFCSGIGGVGGSGVIVDPFGRPVVGDHVKLLVAGAGLRPVRLLHWQPGKSLLTIFCIGVTAMRDFCILMPIDS